MPFETNLKEENPELVAQKIMNEVMNGNMSEFKNLLSTKLDKSLVKHLIDQIRNCGNEAFRRGKYEEAIEYYNQALAGTDDMKQKARLLNNKAAAYSEKKMFTEAMECVKVSIQLDPTWNKNWFRAARILFEMKEYISALKVFEVAKIKSEEASSTEIINWIEITKPLAQKEKALERISTDYNRFDNIGNDDDEEQVEPQADSTTISASDLDFSDDVCPEERKRLEQILTGQYDASIQTPPKLPQRPSFNPLLKFDPKCSVDELKNLTNPTGKQKIKLALLNVLQIQSELNAAHRVARQQFSKVGLRVLQSYVESINQIQSQIRAKEFWFFLGIGTAIPYMTAVQNDKGSSTFTACTNHVFPFSGWMANRMIEINDVTVPPSSRILCKKVADLKIAASDSPLDEELADISQIKYSNLVVDAELFDVTGVGCGALLDIKQTRQKLMVTCKEKGLTVVPARLRIAIRAAQYGHKNTLNDDALEAARWSANWEPIDLERYHSNLKSLTSEEKVTEFIFDGPIDQIDDDIPFQLKQHIKLSVIESGEFNCLILIPYFKFSNINQMIPFNSGMQWVKRRSVVAGSSIELTVSFDGTNFKARVDQPCITEMSHSLALPKWQLDALDDIECVNAWSQVVSDTMREQLEAKIIKCDKRPNFSKPQSVEGLVLNSTLGHILVKAISSSSDLFVGRGAKPLPNFHISVVESSPATSAITRQFLKDNAISMFHAYREQRTPKKNISEWQYFGEKNYNSPTTTDKKENYDNVQGDIGVIKSSPIQIHPSNKKIDSHNKQKVATQTTSAHDEHLLVLLKSRLTILTKDLRQIRPPLHMEDYASRLALAKLIQAPLGSNGPQLPPAQSGDHLNDKVDVLISQSFDCGLLGEGILPFLSYAKEALLKSKSKIIPFKASLYAMGINLSPCLNFSEYDWSCWSSLIGGTGPALNHNIRNHSDYFSINADQSNVQFMTNCQLITQFQFEQNINIKNHQLSFEVVQSGHINAIVFWYELQLESHEDAKARGRENKPLIITTCPQQQMMENNNHVIKSKFGTQACQLIQSLLFNKGESIRIKADFLMSSVIFSWDNLGDLEIRKSLTAPILGDESLLCYWDTLWSKHLQRLDQMSDMYIDKKIHKVVSEAVISIALNPGRYRNHAIDSLEALWFCLTFFYL